MADSTPPSGKAKSRSPRSTTSKRSVSKPGIAKRGPDLSEFRSFLAGLGTPCEPTIHINGTAYAHCIMTLDFGQSLHQTKLGTEPSAEVVSRLRKATRDLFDREVTVRVNTDNHHGIWWTSLG